MTANPGAAAAIGAQREARLAGLPAIERTYNRRRRQRGLGRLTPVEFLLLLSEQPQALAA